MREVYLDNAATTKVRPEIAEAMAKAMVENYGNPSSIVIPSIFVKIIL